jgi:hypothetical protein
MRRDYQALSLANSLDPKRFMKGGNRSGKIPETFAVCPTHATVREGAYTRSVHLWRHLVIYRIQPSPERNSIDLVNWFRALRGTRTLDHMLSESMVICNLSGWRMGVGMDGRSSVGGNLRVGLVWLVNLETWRFGDLADRVVHSTLCV